jgi:hypothetical protein
MRPIKHKATVIFLPITTCIIIVTAALIQTNAPAASSLTSSPVQFAALEIQKQSTRPKINRSRLAQNSCASQDGLRSCECEFYKDCCTARTFCWCSETGCHD